MENLFKGWEYINALMQTLQEQTKNTIIAPRYIFRGITQRHFTSSSYIQERLSNDRKLLKKYWDELLRKHKSTMDQYMEPTPKIQFKYYKELCHIIKNDLSDKAKKHPHSFLRTMLSDRLEDYQCVHPEYIRSSAAVRMNGMRYRTQNDYIYYLKDMIAEMQRRYPHYRTKTDLEILAEIQHKGGASCLVDFSTNFLIALWFATQDYSNKDQQMGYLFCYDTNTDLFINDTITVIDSSSSDTIDQLLAKTQRTIKYNGKERDQYILWKPANINDRISRQDSIFIFGVEKFKVADHPIITLPIPFEWKEPIQQTLKSLFGISSETIYADADGFATSNTKSTSCKITTTYFSDEYLKIDYRSQKGVFDLFQRAMSCIIKKQYSLALKYLYSFEIGVNKKGKLLILDDASLEEQLFYMEVLYSKALCFKHLKQYTKAKPLYENVFNLCKSLCGKCFNSDASCCSQDYAVNKLHKIVDGYIHLLCEENEYNLAINIIDSLKEYVCKEPNDDTNILLGTWANELKLINQIKNGVISNIEFSSVTNPESKLYPFCNILNNLFVYLSELIKNDDPNRIIEYKQNYEDSLTTTMDFCCFIDNGETKYTHWDSEKLKNMLNESHINNLDEMILCIDKAIDCQNYINGSKRVSKY